MASKGTQQLVIGNLMREPTLLLQTDKYDLNTTDFSELVYQYIFYAIHSLVQDGKIGAIGVHEIEQFLGQDTSARALYDARGGQTALIDAAQGGLAVESNFETVYKDLKRENLIQDLRRARFLDSRAVDGDEETNPTLSHDERVKINDEVSNLSATEILEEYEKELMRYKNKYSRGDASETKTIVDGMDELVASLQESPLIGLPLQGDLFNHIISGALPRRLYLRSGGSGLGKTRNAFADAAFLAFPLRFSQSEKRWVFNGHNEKVLFLLTEQEFDEIQLMSLAYLTGINEGVIKRGLASPGQWKLIQQAILVFEYFKSNLRLARIPNPSTALVKQIIREHVMRDDIRYVFYDYIFESPSLYNEFRGMNLRTDQMLFNFSDVLKNLAVELDIFIMSGTQVNAKSDSAKDIRNEAALAGARAVINKADMGCIMARPTTEELTTLREVTAEFGVEPNVVTDIFKVRGGEYTQVRVWSYMDLGILRKKDLFVTNSRLEPVNIAYQNIEFEIDTEEKWEIEKFKERLNGELK